jgi:outer membrane protein assembly factor BamB
MRIRLWVASLLALSCPAGSYAQDASPPSTDRWVTFHHDYQRTGRSPVVGPQSLATYKWRKPVAADDGPLGVVRSSAAIGLQGQIYISGVRGEVSSAVTALASFSPDGTRRWRADMGHGQTDSSPSLASDDTIYVGGGARAGEKKIGSLWSFTGDGAFRWTAPNIDNTVLATPALSPSVDALDLDQDHIVYVGTAVGTGLFYALDFLTGVQIPTWSVPPILGFIGSPPAIGKDGTVYFGSEGDGGRLTAVSPKNGEALWSVPTEGTVYVAPALSNDGSLLYFGSEFGLMYAVETATGHEKWTNLDAGNSYFSSPAVGADGTVYAGNDDGFLYAFDGQTGEVKWKFDTGVDGVERAPIFSSPAVGGDGTIYFGCDNGLILAVNPNGTLKSEYQVVDTEIPGAEAPEVESSPAIGPDGTLYIGADDGYLYAFAGPTVLAGDINQDGKVSIGDASLALRHLVNLIRLTPAQVAIGDVAPKSEPGQPAGDGKVDIQDVIRLLRRAVDLEPDPWP